MDNIGLFDRNTPLPDGSILEQSDSTSWMCMYSLNMMRIALELAQTNPVYQDMATKFFEHFLYIAHAMFAEGEEGTGLWDDEDEFYYDAIQKSNGHDQKLKIRSMVGLIPLLAVEILDDDLLSESERIYGTFILVPQSPARTREPGFEMGRKREKMKNIFYPCCAVIA